MSLQQAAMILLHGRGASAESILELAQEFAHSQFAFLAPQATGYQWYPNRFIAPVEANEPYLSSALATVAEVVKKTGLPQEKIMILGFSQGACLALEFAARQGGKWGGVVALSGGLIGETLTAETYQPLEGTPIFIGCSEVDFHIPLARVKESSVLLRGLGADVTERIYPNLGHSVNLDEIQFVRQMMEQI